MIKIFDYRLIKLVLTHVSFLFICFVSLVVVFTG